jgi:hypothetical protein
MMTDENESVKENEHDNKTSIEELKLRKMFDYETVWHLVGKFEQNDSVNYEEQWVHDQSVIEATVAVWKRDGAIEIMQSEYLFKNGKIRYMVACGGNQ